jgi:hypothetical protein
MGDVTNRAVFEVVATATLTVLPGTAGRVLSVDELRAEQAAEAQEATE